MRLNVNKLLHTPEAQEEVRFEMDLSDLDFGGSMSTTMHCVCDRCGEEYDAEKSVCYDCVLAEERQSEDSDEIIVLEDDEVDLEELARDAFILDMDTKFLCSEDCKGLCAGCGANLNRESCRCKRAVDPRLAKLAQLLQQDGQ